MARINVNLKSDQVHAIRYAEAHHYSINGYLMGKGKSIIGLALSIKTASRTLVVSPSYLRLNWVEEIKDRVDGEYKYHLVDTKSKAYGIIPEGTNIIITSYSMLEHIERFFSWAELVIADEFHLCKNVNAKRTDLFDKYLYESEVPRFLGLTGTPIKNGVDEWYTLLNMCCYNPKDTSGPHLQFSNKYAFAAHFCNSNSFTVNGRKITKYFGVRNLSELKLLLKGKYLSSPPPKIGGDGLPLLVRKDVLVSEKANMDVLREFEEGVVVGKDMVAKTSSAANMVPFAIEYIKGLMEEGVGPVVVFSDHRKPIELIVQKLKAESIMGGDSMRERAEIVKRFQAGKIPILAGTIGAMGVGLNLHRASNAVFIDFPYVPGDLLQAEKRIHRLGQTRDCTIHRLLGSPQAKHIMNILTDKMKTIRRVL